MESVNSEDKLRIKVETRPSYPVQVCNLFGSLLKCNVKRKVKSGTQLWIFSDSKNLLLLKKRKKETRPC
jgi:hypothetical protein